MGCKVIFSNHESYSLPPCPSYVNPLVVSVKRRERKKRGKKRRGEEGGEGKGMEEMGREERRWGGRDGDGRDGEEGAVILGGLASFCSILLLYSPANMVCL